MPLGIYIPSQLNDLALDVAVGTPAQGAVFYRGATHWNALAAGSAGQALVSGGAGADPSWADGPVGSVILAPDSSNRNLVQPTADFIGLTLKASASQVNPIFQVLTNADGVVGTIDATNGRAQFGGVDLTQPIGLLATYGFTETNGTIYGFKNVCAPTPAVDSSATFYGAFFQNNLAGSGNFTSGAGSFGAAYFLNHGGTGTLTLGTGMAMEVNKTSTGVISTAIGISCRIRNQNAIGAIPAGEGIRIVVPQLTGGITTMRGIRIQNQGGTGVTNAQALFIDSQTGAATTNTAIQTNAGLVAFGDRVTITGSSDQIQLLIQGFSTQTNPLLRLRQSSGTLALDIAGTGAKTHNTVDAVTNTTTTVDTIGHNSSGTPANGFGQLHLWRLQSSTTVDQSVAQAAMTWVDATHASRKARVVYSVFDTAAREVWRGEASGSAPMIGFLGASAVVRQTGASAAGIAAITDANAKAAIQAIQTALAAYGLVTSPS